MIREEKTENKRRVIELVTTGGHLSLISLNNSEEWCGTHVRVLEWFHLGGEELAHQTPTPNNNWLRAAGGSEAVNCLALLACCVDGQRLLLQPEEVLR